MRNNFYFLLVFIASKNRRSGEEVSAFAETDVKPDIINKWVLYRKIDR